MTQIGKDRRGHRPDATCGTCDQNRTILDPVIFQRHDGQHCGKARSPHSHRLTRCQTVRQRHQHIRFDPRLLRVTAPAVFTDTPPRQHHLVAGFVAVVRGGFDGSGKVDARNVRIIPDQSATRPDAQTVFVVHGRIFNGNRYLAFRQLVFADFCDGRGSLSFVILFYEQCFKHVSSHSHGA